MNIPTMNPVESSQITAIGYDPEARRLFILFKNGAATYAYENVSEVQYENLMNAESVGSYFSRTIQTNPGAHPYKKIA